MTLKVSSLNKSFVTMDKHAAGIFDINFELAPGSFFTLLGPSGCGKTTTLRCVAGLQEPDSGQIGVSDRVYFDSGTGTNLQMNKRGIGMVFQSYAIWPHMTVGQNVVFPLTVANAPKRGAVRAACREVFVKLYWSPTSPFARKVMIVAQEKQLLTSIELVRCSASWTQAPAPMLLAHNPLAKIPTLVIDTGMALFDSRVICDYLDAKGEGAALLPADFTQRLACLRWQALGDGVTDALLLMATELERGEARNAVIVDGLGAKVRAALRRLDHEAGSLAAVPFGLGHVSIACMLGHIDARLPDSGWRLAHPRLAAWYGGVEARPSMHMTVVGDETNSANDDPLTAMPLKFVAA